MKNDLSVVTVVGAGPPLRHDIERWCLPLAGMNTVAHNGETGYDAATRVFRGLAQPGEVWPRERWEVAADMVQSMADAAGEYAEIRDVPHAGPLREMRLQQQRHLTDIAKRLRVAAALASPATEDDDD